MLDVSLRRGDICFLLLAFALALISAMAVESSVAKAGSFQTLLNVDGSGRIFVNNGSTPTWMICAPSRSNCSPFATGDDISTNGAPPNVVFRAETHALEEPEWVTPTWFGNVTSVGPPSVSGRIKANELVTPVPGRWWGGWSTDGDAMQLAACENPSGDGCVTLTERTYPASCPNEAVVIDPTFVGWYLRVADQRLPADTAFTFEAATTPYGGEVWPQSVTVSTTIVGRIGPPAQRRTAQCGPPPLIRAAISASALAHVKCGLGCKATLIAKRGGRAVRRSRNLRPFPLASARGVPVPKLALPSKALSSLGPGRARVVLQVNGKRVARRTVVLR